ncbi:MAG: phosphate/phosphite/phosphonate ABC transporter substrate-binding protein, partial [bacterium]
MQPSNIMAGLNRRAVFCFFLFIVVASSPAAAREVVFGINPWADAPEMRKMCQPLIDYITEQSGVPIRIAIPPTYEYLVDDFVAGHTKLASVNSVTFLKIKRRLPNTRYLATTVQGEGDERRDHYIGYIIAPKDAPYDSLDDLEGTVFGFVDVDSASGYKMPRAMLGLRGLSPDTFFKKHFFVGDHDELALAVKNKCVDAGATWDNSYRVNTERLGDIFKIIERTPPIPNDAWIAHPSLPKRVADGIRDVLLSVSPLDVTSDGRLVLDPSLGQPAEGFTELDPGFYEQAA